MKRLLASYPVLLSIAWALIILVLCATPGQYIPSADWMELLSLDKLVHATIFFIMTSLLLLVCFKYRQGNIFVILYALLSLAYGLLMEIMQALYFSNRSADWMDVAANSAGCLFALIFLKKIRMWIFPAFI